MSEECTRCGGEFEELRTYHTLDGYDGGTVTEHLCERCYLIMTGRSERHDPVDHPKHYTQHPSGVECIQITEHMGFCVGNAIKYLWRADLKNGLEDLEKARWYVNREIERRQKDEKASES